jgi:hypothetical protein
VEATNLVTSDEVYSTVLPRIAPVAYSFGVNGGGIGTISLPIGMTIPAGSVVYGLVINTTTNVTSATDNATVALGINTAGDLQAATLVSATPFNVGATTTIIAASPVTVSSNTTVIMTVGVEALLTGAFTASLLYQ